jgi:DNA-directed RNA polymerase subunit RPC12/RpoP
MENDEIVCPSCGKTVRKNAVRNLIRDPICPYCGFGIIELSIIPKSKTVSIVLAVLFGFWSWLYTYRKDRIKFWSFLGLILGLIIVFGFTINVFILAAVGIYVIGWIIALIDAVRRPNSFFRDYSKINLVNKEI